MNVLSFKRFAFPLLSLTFVFPIFAQYSEHKFEHISVENGLSQNTINAIIQDQQGFLWFGTEDGLNRYDGYDFKIYKNDPGDKNSLSNNFIWSLCQDSKGNIWIGTDGGGVNRFDPIKEKFKSYYQIPGDSSALSFDLVQCVFVDSEGIVWVGSWGGGLLQYDEASETFTPFVLEPVEEHGIISNKIWTIFEDSQRNLWIATDGGGVNLLDRKTGRFTHFVHDSTNQNSISHNAVTSVFEDGNGDMWFGTYGGGLNKFDLKTKTFTRYKYERKNAASISDNFIWKIFEDRRGTLWIGTMSKGLNIYDRSRDRFSQVRHSENDPKSLSTDYVRSIFEDRSGVMWIGTLVGGVNKIDRKTPKFTHIKKQPKLANSLIHDFVFTLCEDKQGDIWIGTYGGGVSRYNPRTQLYKYYKNDPNDPGSLSSDQVRVIYEDSQGTIWIGTYFGGLNKYLPETDSFKRYRAQSEVKGRLTDENIRCLFEDQDGDFWIGTNGGGLNKLNRQFDTFTHFLHDPENENSLSNDHVLCIREDKIGDLWIGTYGGGLNRFNKKTGLFTRFQMSPEDKTSLSNDVVTEVYVDCSGQVWAGTWGGGINKFIREETKEGNEGQGYFVHFNEKNGLSNNIICGILEDDTGNLWISTNKGISKFNPRDESFKNYDYSDGLQQAEMNPGAALKTRGGWMYFGGVAGINSFHPDSVKDNPYIPNIVITDFKIFNESVALQTIKRSSSQARNMKQHHIEMNYDDRFFSFEFAALDFTHPEKNQYAYMMEGFDSDWINHGSRRYASYTNLDPGVYAFRVKGSNNDGIWNEEGISVSIKIIPPFWMSGWFRLFIMVLFVGITYLVYNYRVSTLKKEKAAQEEFSKKLIDVQEKERKRIASELHDRLGQNLLIIRNTIQQYIKEILHRNQPVADLQEVSSIALQSINEVREISHNLHPHQLERIGLKKTIESMRDRFSQASNLNIKLHIGEVDGLFHKDEEINIYRIIQEGMNNIIKHSGATEVNIDLHKCNNTLNILVQDNGKGFDVNADVDNRSNEAGFGLAGMAERVKILKGKFEIKSSSGKGTRINIRIPVLAKHGKEI